jgi:hypothetical protein
MKIAVWFSLFLVFPAPAMQAQEYNRTITDPKYDKEVLIGYCNRAGLESGDFGEDFEYEYQAYEADRQIMAELAEVENEPEIILVLGTWCSDSREQVPRFYRILDDAGLPDDRITLICVDGNKTGGDVSIDHLDIEFVPTFIFYREGEEIGRIIETPGISLETDILNIIR